MRETIGTVHIGTQNMRALTATAQKPKAVRTHKAKRKRDFEDPDTQSREHKKAKTDD